MQLSSLFFTIIKNPSVRPDYKRNDFRLEIYNIKMTILRVTVWTVLMT